MIESNIYLEMILHTNLDLTNDSTETKPFSSFRGNDSTENPCHCFYGGDGFFIYRAVARIFDN